MASQGQAALWSAVEAVRSSWPVSPVSSSSTFTIGIHMEGSDVLNVSRRDSGDPRTTVVARAGPGTRRLVCLPPVAVREGFMLRAPATDGAAIAHRPRRALHRAAGRWAGSKGKSVKRLSPPDPSRSPRNALPCADAHARAPQTRQAGVRPPTRTHQQQHQIKNPRHHPPQRGRVWDHPLSKGAATTSSKTTAKNETSQPTDHYAIEYFSS